MAYIEHGNGRPWHKRVLIPFWLIQIAIMGISVAAAAISIYLFSSNTVTINSTSSDGSNTSNITTYSMGDINSNGTTVVFSSSFSSSSSLNRGVVIAIYAISLTFALIGLLLSFSEIVLFARHHLTPGKYFGFNLFKFLGWTANFILGIVNTVLYGSYLWTLVVSIVVELTFLGSLIYACVIFHRYRKGERFDGAQGKGYAPSPPMGVSNGGPEAVPTQGYAPSQGYVPNQQYPSNTRGGNGSYA